MVAVVVGKKEAEIIDDANKIYNIFKSHFDVFAPMPAPISKINDNYRWRVLIKAKVTDNDIDIINYCLESFEKSKHKDTKLNFDINPNNMM